MKYLCPNCEYEAEKDRCSICGSDTIQCEKLFEQHISHTCSKCFSLVIKKRHVKTADEYVKQVSVLFCPRCQSYTAHVCHINRVEEVSNFTDILSNDYEKELTKDGLS